MGIVAKVQVRMVFTVWMKVFSYFSNAEI